jgi:hypothetical protein
VTYVVGCFGCNGGREEKLMNGGFAGENESDGFFFSVWGLLEMKKLKMIEVVFLVQRC